MAWNSSLNPSRSVKEMLARVQAHLRRVESHRRPEGDRAIEADGLVIDPEQVQAFAEGRPVGLTPREFSVLYALARAEDAGVEAQAEEAEEASAEAVGSSRSRRVSTK